VSKNDDSIVWVDLTTGKRYSIARKCAVTKIAELIKEFENKQFTSEEREKKNAEIVAKRMAHAKAASEARNREIEKSRLCVVIEPVIPGTAFPKTLEWKNKQLKYAQSLMAELHSPDICFHTTIDDRTLNSPYSYLPPEHVDLRIVMPLNPRSIPKDYNHKHVKDHEHQHVKCIIEDTGREVTVYRNIVARRAIELLKLIEGAKSVFHEDNQKMSELMQDASEQFYKSPSPVSEPVHHAFFPGTARKKIVAKIANLLEQLVDS